MNRRHETTNHKSMAATTRSPLEHAIALLGASLAAAKAMPTLLSNERRDACRMSCGAHALAIDELMRALDEDPNLQALAARVERRLRLQGERPRTSHQIQRQRVIDMRRAGATFTEISEALNVPIGSAKTWVRQARIESQCEGGVA